MSEDQHERADANEDPLTVVQAQAAGVDLFCPNCGGRGWTYWLGDCVPCGMCQREKEEHHGQ